MGCHNSTLVSLVSNGTGIMSHPSVIYWPPSAGFESIIAHAQDVPEDDTLELLGNVTEAPGIFKYHNIIRSIIIHSPDNNATASFVVSGIGAAVDANRNPTSVLRPITETIIGVNANEVESTHIFTQINSITVRGDGVTDVSVKYGSFGITQYVFMDYNRTFVHIAGSVQVVADAGIEYAAYMSYNKPELSTINNYHEVLLGVVTVPLSSALEPFGVQLVAERPKQITFIPAFELIPHTTTGTNTAFVNDGPAAVVWATIRATTTDSLYFTVLQQGIS